MSQLVIIFCDGDIDGTTVTDTVAEARAFQRGMDYGTGYFGAVLWPQDSVERTHFKPGVYTECQAIYSRSLGDDT
jgi:hypothetical protein